MSDEKITLHTLARTPGSHRNRKRLGRGPGSGTGKTSVKLVKGPAKLLANGGIDRAVTVRGIKVSAGAREKIVAAGGTIEE